YYPREGESIERAIERECTAVREHAGVYDGSPLGKLVVKGPDALALLETMYTQSFARLAEGQGRYTMMLGDDGLIVDDGVVFKLAEGSYLVTTSTANADLVYRKLEDFAQIERPEWQLTITPVT